MLKLWQKIFQTSPMLESFAAKVWWLNFDCPWFAVENGQTSNLEDFLPWVRNFFRGWGGACAPSRPPWLRPWWYVSQLSHIFKSTQIIILRGHVSQVIPMIFLPHRMNKMFSAVRRNFILSRQRVKLVPLNLSNFTKHWFITLKLATLYPPSIVNIVLKLSKNLIW